MGMRGSILNALKTPLGTVLMLVVLLVLAGMSIAATISGDLTAAATSSAGFVTIVILVAMVNNIGK